MSDLIVNVPCIHRGEVLGNAQGETGFFQVHECAIHGYCSMARRREDVRDCGTCADRNVETAKPILGLGDVVAKVTSALGVKPCDGCKQRQQKLNELFPL